MGHLCVAVPDDLFDEVIELMHFRVVLCELVFLECLQKFHVVLPVLDGLEFGHTRHQDFIEDILG